jgi:hypothetical protein
MNYDIKLKIFNYQNIIYVSSIYYKNMIFSQIKTEKFIKIKTHNKINNK